MVSGLLQEHEHDTRVREQLIDHYGPARAATVAISVYESRDPGNYRHRINSRLQALLYGPQAAMHGRLLEYVVAFAASMAARGRSVHLVTPNFDTHLLDELRVEFARQEKERGAALPDIRHFIAGKQSLGELNDWMKDGAVICASVHGVLPERGAAESNPVITST